MTMIAVLRHGFSAATRHWRLVALLLLVNIASAAVLLLVPATTLRNAANYTAIREAAAGVQFWQAAELFLASESQAQLDLPESSATINAIGTTALGVFGLLPFLAAMPAAFLKGGVYSVLFRPNQTPARKTFTKGAWHWFVPFLLLALLNFGLFFGLTSLFFILIGAVGQVINSGILLMGLLLLFFFWWQLSELTGAMLIVHNRRNVFWAGTQAVGFMLRGFGRINAFYLITLLIILAVHSLFRFGLHPRVPLVWWPVVLLVNQIFIVSRLWLKVARLGSITALVAADSNANSALDNAGDSAETATLQPDLI